MTVNILSQGLTTNIENSVGTAMVTYLSSSDYKRFTCISAFASESGVNGLTQYIEKAKEIYESLNIIVGVDLKGTSKEALEALLGLGINTLIFYQPGFSIFHPKIYLFEGEHRSQLIVGSSNLTTQGLFVNVEAAIHVELNHDLVQDQQLIANLKTSFAGLFDFTDPNLQPISQALIQQFVAEKIVPTEAERKEIQDKVNELEEQSNEPVERIIRTLFPKRQLPSAPKEFRRKRVKKTTVSKSEHIDSPSDNTAEQITEKIEDEDFTLVWEMPNIPGSSVQATKSATTNPTGMLRLVQAGFQSNGIVIDHTSYFRAKVFNSLSWVSKTAKTEIAIGRFRMSIIGKSIGEHPLEIRHKPSGESNQGNYTTGISWGRHVGKIIQASTLAGRTIRLYRSNRSDNIFKIEFS